MLFVLCHVLLFIFCLTVSGSAGRLLATRLTALTNAHASMSPPQSNPLHSVAKKKRNYSFTAMMSFAVYQKTGCRSKKPHFSSRSRCLCEGFKLSLHSVCLAQGCVVYNSTTHTALCNSHTHIHKSDQHVFLWSRSVTARREGWMDGGINDKLSPLI